MSTNGPDAGQYLLDSSSRTIEHDAEQRPGMLALLLTLVRFVAGQARQAVSTRVARVAMYRIRRDPSTLVNALRQARQILIVCHGNIIRSAFAAHLLQQRVGPAGRIRITSAGLEAVPGRPPHPLAVLMARRVGVDLTRHTASRVSAEDVRASDLVFAVDLIQFVAMRERFPDARHKMYLLTSLAPTTPLEIADPIDGGGPAFEVCFAHISRAVDPIRQAIDESSTSP